MERVNGKGEREPIEGACSKITETETVLEDWLRRLIRRSHDGLEDE